MPDWIASQQRAFRFFDGVTATIVPDNLKAGVTKPHRYEPELNRTYTEMAAHYSTALLPTRVAKPRDETKVDVGVQVVERWILARPRSMSVFSLDELNRAIAELLARLNTRPSRKLPGSRRELYEQLNHPALQPLPAEPYTFAVWKKPRVNIDYHIELERHFRAPYTCLLPINCQTKMLSKAA